MLEFLKMVSKVPGYEEPTTLSDMDDGEHPEKAVMSWIHGNDEQAPGAGITFSIPERSR